jgi:hypothetical protein
LGAANKQQALIVCHGFEPWHIYLTLALNSKLISGKVLEKLMLLTIHIF